jgi:hypothetical protein
VVTYDLFGSHFVDPGKETANAANQGDGQHRLEKLSLLAHKFLDLTDHFLNFPVLHPSI